ncbi:flippase [Paenibacillus timonensis]|uniref:Flippase n=1 Tax=Paenibacillus timonensis TaxID=225915 RepID=A0ABW3SAK4_9BACL|nr:MULTISPECIES: flippase [Paenibacillus]MCH1640115.1 flippase [Paenibacillus timonensis]MDU2239852.1 flippase [Paenibacillus sp.]
MKKSSSTLNFLYSMIYQVLIMILPLATAPYLARVIGAEGAGIYSYTFSIAQYFLYFAMLGVNNYGNRSISAVRDKGQDELNKTFSSIFVFQVMTSALSITAYVIYLCLGVKENFLIAAFQMIFVASALLDINWFFFGLEEFKKTVTRKILIKLITVVCVFIFVKSVGDLWKYTLIMTLSYFVGQIYLWMFVRKFVSFVKTDYRTVFQHFKPNLLLFVPLIATSIYRIMSKIMIGNFSTMAEVGYYEYSEKLINICLAAIVALGTVMLPKMSNLVANNKNEELEKYLEKSMQVAMFMGCAIAFGLASISNDFIPIFYGKGFEDSIVITKILTITVLFISWANVIRMQYLIPNKMEHVYVKAVCFGAVLNFAINLITIPMLGAIGAAIGTISAELFVSIYQTYCVRKKLHLYKFFRQGVIYLFSGLVMFSVVTVISSYTQPSIFMLLGEIFIGASIYMSICTLYFVKTRNELFIRVIRIFSIKQRVKRKVKVSNE